MLEGWGFDFIIGIGTIFLNPLFYWGIILVIITGSKRIKREREKFGFKIFPLFSETKHIWPITLTFSILLSFISITFGTIFTIETIAILFFVSIIVSLTGSLKLLSASFTIGVTTILLFGLNYLNLETIVHFPFNEQILQTQYSSLAFIIAILLLFESIIVREKFNQPTYPTMTMSTRGRLVGQHNLKKLSMVPFITFIPTDLLGDFSPIFPMFEYGNESMSLILFPILVGFDYRVRGDLPANVMKGLGKATLFLSIIVLLLAGASLFYEWVAFVAIGFAFIGRLYIATIFKQRDNKKAFFFRPLNKGAKVLAVLPNGPADRLGIKVGETIYKVNGQVVTNSHQFYLALQNSGAFFKLEVLDFADEVRFITSAFYEQDHHELGIVFSERNDY